MKAAEKEVEHLERKAREQAGLPVEPGEGGTPLPAIQLPEFSVMRDHMRASRRKKVETERYQLEAKASEIEVQMKDVQARLKALNESGVDIGIPSRVAPERASEPSISEKENHQNSNLESNAAEESVEAISEEPNETGAPGRDGDFVEFPPYDGSE